MVPALSFIETANAVAQVGAHPLFVDGDAQTLGMSANAVGELLASSQRSNGAIFNPMTGRRIDAIVRMHVLGHPMRIAELVTVADEHRVPVVEDAAEPLGSFADGQHTDTFGRLGILSFNGNKIVTTGGGGIVLTNDLEIARHAKHLTTTAK